MRDDAATRFRTGTGQAAGTTLAELLRKGERVARRAGIVMTAIAVLFGVLLVWQPIGTTWPVAAVTVALLPLLAVRNFRLARQLGLTLRQVAGQPFARIALPGDALLRRGRTVSFRAGDGDWVVLDLPEEHWRTLARQRRVSMAGPDGAGRVSVLVPGCVLPRGGRIEPEPVPGSAPVPAEPGEVTAPAGDPVVAACYRSLRGDSLIGVFATVLAQAWIVGGFLVDPAKFAAGNLLTVCYFLFFQICLVTLIWPVRSGVPLDLYVNVREDQRLWVFGDAKTGRMAAGVPGCPALGVVKLEPLGGP